MIATIERGQARSGRPPLLFVHGAMHGAWAWDEHFLPYFAEHGWRTIALDLRGHGRSPSDKAVTWVSVNDYIADVAEVAARFDQPPILIGHSLGGFVVQRYLENHAARAGVLVGSAPPSGALRLTLRATRRDPVGVARVFTTFKLFQLFGQPEAARYWYFSADKPDPDTTRYINRLQEESFRAVLDTLTRPVRTRMVTVPMLAIVGSEDYTVPPRDHSIAARKYDLTPIVVDGLPHDLMLVPGWQRAASHILNWIEALR
ncbi:alpha/beta fold hydrolase [Tsukamurella sp. 8F]|uniref:alpha/beta hydrolase n=1 Tax=unclassified Tsukamurella TaxID=2633480 RepID=UPI0023B9338B|nr:MULTISPECIES: alpha/beta fold hydrolase [unclassified Tsukamurella]MDF0531817.1 alpha/beta fold hydrolase [Tsukamurella sp. 8J]MDF0589059.1 alpha/beta fold hydrolase [Tsukamurella sp. 8F]